MNDPRGIDPRADPRDAGAAPDMLEQPPASYAGRTRYTQLEYDALLANLSIGIAFTRDRCFFLCNPRFAEMFGWGPDELIGKPGEVAYPSRESYEALGQIAVPILSSGRQLDLEWEMRRKDGSTFLARIIAKPIDSQNTQQGTVWIVEDITERRRHADQAQRLLREQEAILGTASIGIVFLKDRRIARCNRRYEEMYGYEPGGMDGLPTAALYADPGDEVKAQFSYAQLARGQTARRVEPRKRKDGSVFWTRADGRAVDPQEPLKGSVWIVEDITEQRHAEDELQRVLAQQQALLNNVVVGIQFTRERKTVRCNRRFEELFGYAAGAAVGASTRDFYFTDEEWEKAGTYGYDEINLGRTHTREQWVRRQDGSGFWCRISGRAVEAGEPSKGYVWLLEDITERKRADESPAASRRSSATSRASCSIARRASCSAATRNSSRAAARCTTACGAATRSTSSAPTCARTGRRSGARFPAAPCSPAIRRRARSGCSRTSPRSARPRSGCSARSPSRS